MRRSTLFACALVAACVDSMPAERPGDGGVDTGVDGAMTDGRVIGGPRIEGCGCPASSPKCCARVDDSVCLGEDDPRTGCGEATCDPCPSPAHALSGCSAGSCGFTCELGYGDCDGEPANGCEVDFSEPENCGACGETCTDAPGIVSATCTARSCLVLSCTTGLFDCNRDAADGCEADVANDPSTCGLCEVSCAEGAECSDGMCRGLREATIITVVEGLPITRGPSALAVDGDDVYVNTGTELLRFADSGRSEREDVLGEPVYAFAFGATEIFATTAEGTVAIAKTGFAVRPVSDRSGPLSVLSDRLFVAADDQVLELDPEAALEPQLVASEPLGDISFLVGEGERLYWGVAGDPFGENQTAVRSVAVDGGEPDTIFTETATRAVASLAAYDGEAFFVSGSALYRGSVGAAAVMIAPLIRDVGGFSEDPGVAARDGSIWYANTGLGQIVRRELDDGEQILIALNYRPQAIAVDASYVYWTDLPARMAGGSYDEYRVYRADR